MTECCTVNSTERRLISRYLPTLPAEKEPERAALAKFKFIQEFFFCSFTRYVFSDINSLKCSQRVCRLAASLGLLLLCVCMCLSGVRQTVASCRKNWWNWRDRWCGWRPPAENKNNCVAGCRAVKECSRWGFLVCGRKGCRLVSLIEALCLLAYLIFLNLLPPCMCPSLCVVTQCVCVFVLTICCISGAPPQVSAQFLLSFSFWEKLSFCLPAGRGICYHFSDAVAEN